MSNIYRNSVLLIGPQGTWKSKLGKLLSESLNLRYTTLDDTRDIYYKELNYDKKYADKLKKEKGNSARYEYWNKFEAHHVKRFLEELREPLIIEFEATHTVYENPELFEKVKWIMDHFKNVILILPDIDLTESVEMINNTRKIPKLSDLAKHNDKLVRSACNSKLATYTVCINDRNLEEVAEEILKFVKK